MASMSTVDSKAVIIVGVVGTESSLYKITAPKGFLTQQKFIFHTRYSQCNHVASTLPIATETGAFLEFTCLPEQQSVLTVSKSQCYPRMQNFGLGRWLSQLSTCYVSMKDQVQFPELTAVEADSRVPRACC